MALACSSPLQVLCAFFSLFSVSWLCFFATVCPTSLRWNNCRLSRSSLCWAGFNNNITTWSETRSSLEWDSFLPTYGNPFTTYLLSLSTACQIFLPLFVRLWRHVLRKWTMYLLGKSVHPQCWNPRYVTWNTVLYWPLPHHRKLSKCVCFQPLRSFTVE